MATTTPKKQNVRIYRHGDRLIRASHPSHVLAFVAQEMARPTVATTDEVADLVGKGVKVETVRHEQQVLQA